VAKVEAKTTLAKADLPDVLREMLSFAVSRRRWRSASAPVSSPDSST
jgi:hypothetical protein